MPVNVTLIAEIGVNHNGLARARPVRRRRRCSRGCRRGQVPDFQGGCSCIRGDSQSPLPGTGYPKF